MIQKFIFFIFYYLLITAKAYASLDITLTKGINNARPVAIIPFHNMKTGSIPVDIAEVISNNLYYSGRFSPIAPKVMPQLAWRQEAIQFKKWTALGAEIILIGRVTPLVKDQFRIEYELLDTFVAAKNNKPSITKSNLSQLANAQILDKGDRVVNSNQLRQYAHIVSDRIYEILTGERGAFLTRIAYVIFNKNNRYPYQLKVSDYDGKNEQTLLRSKKPIMSPDWSPDGQQIAYVSFEKHKSEIYIQNIYTQQRQLASSAPGINGAPRWSPDGKQLAIMLSYERQPDVYILTISSKKLKQITYRGGIETEPSWSPDGKSLIFSSNRGGKPQIYLVTLANGKVSRLTWNGDLNLNGAITPNGKQLIMVTRLQGRDRIARQDLTTGEGFQFLTNTAFDESPSIAPNGSMVIYSTIVNGRTILSLVSMDGRVKVKLFSAKGRVLAPAWSPFIN